MNHPSFSLTKKNEECGPRSTLLTPSEEELETLRFMRSQEKARYSKSRVKRMRELRETGCYYPEKLPFAECVHAHPPSLLTFHPTRKHLRPATHLGVIHIRKSLLVRVRDKRENAADQDILSPAVLRFLRGWHALSLFTRFCGYATCRKGLSSLYEVGNLC